MYQIERNSMNLRSRITGRVIANKDQHMLWMNMQRTWWVVSGKDPRKAAYFSDGLMLDVQSVAAPGGVSVKVTRADAPVPACASPLLRFLQSRPVYNFFGGKGGGKKRRRLVNNGDY